MSEKKRMLNIFDFYVIYYQIKDQIVKICID